VLDQLLCPKCHNIMYRYERNGVHVDSCDGCGGLFLDRGELEHLIQAEAAYYGATPAPRPVPMRSGGGPRYDDDDRDYRRYSRKKKARGFLDDLLDF